MDCGFLPCHWAKRAIMSSALATPRSGLKYQNRSEEILDQIECEHPFIYCIARHHSGCSPLVNWVGEVASSNLVVLELENRQVSAFNVPHGIIGLNHLDEPTGNVWMSPVAVVPNQYLRCRGHQGLFCIVAHVGIGVRAVNKEYLGCWKSVVRCIAEVLLYGCDGRVCQIFGPSRRVEIRCQSSFGIPAPLSLKFSGKSMAWISAPGKFKAIKRVVYPLNVPISRTVFGERSTRMLSTAKRSHNGRDPSTKSVPRRCESLA
jgi:hypothetical protein